MLPWEVTLSMPKVKRAGYVSLSWAGDHSPHHVHVYRDGKLVVKWDLENWRPMKGKANKRLQQLIRDLLQEGRI